MPLPEPAPRYGLPADALVAFAADGQVVFRVLKGAEPGRNDFRSDEAAGRPRGPPEPWIEHAGLSAWDDITIAHANVSRFPVYVAEVELPPESWCSIAKTGPPRHFTVWAESKVLLGGLRAVYRQKYANGPAEQRP